MEEEELGIPLEWEAECSGMLEMVKKQGLPLEQEMRINQGWIQDMVSVGEVHVVG